MIYLPFTRVNAFKSPFFGFLEPEKYYFCLVRKLHGDLKLFTKSTRCVHSDSSDWFTQILMTEFQKNSRNPRIIVKYCLPHLYQNTINMNRIPLYHVRNPLPLQLPPAPPPLVQEFFHRKF